MESFKFRIKKKELEEERRKEKYTEELRMFEKKREEAIFPKRNFQ